MLTEIDRTLQRLYETHGFSKLTGTVQVENERDTARVLAYGEVIALESLRERLAEGV